MTKQIHNKKLAKARNILFIALSFLGPIVFEIANTITGSWCDNQGKINITVGKVITIIVGAVYLITISYLAWRTYSEKKDIEVLENALASAKNDISSKNNVLSDIENALGYSMECVKKQSDYLSKNQDTKIRELEIVNFATTACAIYHRILSEYLGSQQFTVNIYHKYQKEDRKTYHTMVAHEGHITSPKYFGTERLLRTNKNNYLCDKILLSDNPEYRLILDPEEVSKQFQKVSGNCKYKQYIAIPIMDNHNHIKLMVEINVINQCILEKDQEKILNMLNELFTPVNNYLKLMISIEEYAQNVEYELCSGGDAGYEARL